MATRISVDETFNFRPVGAGFLRPGRLYRSDALHRLTKDGRATLKTLQIGTVIDLRSALDRRIGGRDRLRGTGATLVSIPIAGTDRHTDPATITLRSVYRTILTDYARDLATVIRVIAASEGPVVVHCTAGKDRTGLVSALVLHAVGASREDVLADYALTAPNLAGEWSDRMIRKVKRIRVVLNDRLIEVLTGAPVAVMADTLDWLDAEYGSIDDYLASIGIAAEDVAALRWRLL